MGKLRQLAVIIAAIGYGVMGSLGLAEEKPPSGKVSRSHTRVQGFQNPELDFQLLRQIGAVAYGGASLGECLNAASRVRENDLDSWLAVFAEMGRRQEADGEARAGKGHKISARDQYWKAANSYRAAEYFADIRAPRHREPGLKSRAVFLRAMALTDFRIEVLEIPFVPGVSGPSTLKVFTEEEGADAQCQGRNPGFSWAVLFEGPDERFR